MEPFSEFMQGLPGQKACVCFCEAVSSQFTCVTNLMDGMSPWFRVGREWVIYKTHQWHTISLALCVCVCYIGLC